MLASTDFIIIIIFNMGNTYSFLSGPATFPDEPQNYILNCFKVSQLIEYLH